MSTFFLPQAIPVVEPTKVVVLPTTAVTVPPQTSTTSQSLTPPLVTPTPDASSVISVSISGQSVNMVSDIASPNCSAPSLCVHSKTSQFTMDRQLEFRKIVAEIISGCCNDSNSDQCQVVKTKYVSSLNIPLHRVFFFNVYRREVVDISEENVFITDVENGSDNDSVQFTMFVTTSSDRSSFLKPESIESCLKVRDMLQNISTHYSLFRVARKS